MGTSWLPVCALKKGCTYAFVRDSVFDLVNNDLHVSVCKEGGTDSDHLFEFLQVPEHRTRICNFVNDLNGDYSREAIVVKWVEAFANEDNRLLGCGCPRGVQIKGLKLMVDWIHTLTAKATTNKIHIGNLQDTAFRDQKIIRLTRTNLWERYLSLLKAQGEIIPALHDKF